MSDMRDGLVHCKCQGRPMSVRIADVRKALYVEFLHFASSQDSSITGISTVMTQVTKFADSCSRAVLRFG
eukprot:2592872-Pyramimonas_sp.AAC.1